MIYLQTRGTNRDYTFLGQTPPEQVRNWWLAYGNYTAFEDRTFLMESNSEGVRIYLSAIPSTRKDKVRSTIRYTLVIEKARNEGAVENGKISNESILKLTHLWLKNPTKLSEKLDQVFTSDFVDEAISGSLPVDNQLEGFIKSIEEEGILEDVITKKISSMVEGEEGALLLLNLLEKEADIRASFKDTVVDHYFISHELDRILVHLQKKKTITALSVPLQGQVDTPPQTLFPPKMEPTDQKILPKKVLIVVGVLVVIMLWIWLK